MRNVRGEKASMAAVRELAKLAQNRVGQVLRNKWRVERLIDVGGMAAVYEATHRNGNRVAIKILHPNFAAIPDARDRFLREGYASNKVGHPGAVAVLDDDELDDGSVFLVMELLQGGSLQARLDEKTVLSPIEAMEIGERVLDVLAAAHDKGIVHRDIKPGNLFLTTTGDVKVLDFGLARVRERAFKGSMTRTGMVIGTAAYMPPEQARGKHDAVDQRTDIWALGATLFKALTGRYVHLGETMNERLIAAMSEQAPRLCSIAPDVPASLGRVIDRALAFQKTDRWENARAMQSALHDVYEEIVGRPVPAIERVQWSAAWVPTRRSSELANAEEDLHVSVVIDNDPADARSIVVEFEDDVGTSERYTLKRVESPRSADQEPLSEVTLVDTPGKKRG